ncbi:MAG: 5'-deoxyadenosine deaminase [Phycisphaerae bacterium]|nr:5'-deoxyadenosine deaminase [Phycisphaerae bacterium]
MPTLQGTLLQPRTASECTVTPHAELHIAGDGRISSITTARSSGDHLGDEQCWILPGFIDAHLHTPQWDRRGVDGLSLEKWQKQVAYPAEERMKDASLAEKLAEEMVSGLLACGTTTIAAYGSPFAAATDRIFGVLARRGVRAIFGMMLNDAHTPAGLQQSTEEALNQARDLASRWHGSENHRLHYAFCLRHPLNCSERLMRGTAELAKMFNCYIQTNVGESLSDVAAVRERFPDQLDDVDLFSELGLLSSRTILGHGVVLNHDERRQVAESGAVLVHCPTANLFMESGLMDYSALRAANINVVLGSSIASGFDPFMVRVAQAALQTAKALRVHAVPRQIHRAPTPAEAWWSITRGAAEALGLGDRIGLLEPGYEADCLVVRPERWINDLPTDQRISALLYTLRPEQIEHVLIAGRRVGP